MTTIVYSQPYVIGKDKAVYLSYYEYAYRAVEVGIVLDSLLLSLALAERMRIIDNEKFETQKQITIEI